MAGARRERRREDQRVVDGDRHDAERARDCDRHDARPEDPRRIRVEPSRDREARAVEMRSAHNRIQPTSWLNVAGSDRTHGDERRERGAVPARAEERDAVAGAD
jgi:hypothetical protein